MSNAHDPSPGRGFVVAADPFTDSPPADTADAASDEATALGAHGFDPDEFDGRRTG
jgi:hypothetical protein